MEHNITQQNTFCAALSTSQVLKVARQKSYNVVFCLIWERNTWPIHTKKRDIYYINIKRFFTGSLMPVTQNICSYPTSWWWLLLEVFLLPVFRQNHGGLIWLTNAVAFMGKGPNITPDQRFLDDWKSNDRPYKYSFIELWNVNIQR